MKLVILLLISLSSMRLSAQEGVDGLNGVSFVLPVQGTKYQVDSGYLNEKSLDSFLSSFYSELENVTPLSAARNEKEIKELVQKKKSRRKLIVDVHVPAELEPKEKAEFLRKIENKFSKWDNVELRMQEISKIALRNKATEQNRRIQMAGEIVPQGTMHPKVSELLQKENDALPKNHESWLRGWRTNTVFQIARIFPIGAGIASASLLISKVGLQTPYAVAIGASIGLIELGSQYATNRWAVEFNNWKEQVTLPFASKIKWVYWLNERHFFKAAMFNFTVFATAKTSLYRYFMDVANPKIGGLSPEFFGQIAAAGAGGAIFGALGHIGFRDMVKNGYIGPNIRKYLLWGLALQGIVGGGLITAGATTLVPYFIAFNWGVNGLAFLTGKLLPPRANRGSVYHGELTAYGLDVKLKSHNEETEALSRKNNSYVQDGQTIEVEGKSLKEIVELVEKERAKKPLTEKIYESVQRSISKVLPKSIKSNCIEMMFRNPPYKNY